MYSYVNPSGTLYPLRISSYHAHLDLWPSARSRAPSTLSLPARLRTDPANPPTILLLGHLQLRQLPAAASSTAVIVKDYASRHWISTNACRSLPRPSLISSRVPYPLTPPSAPTHPPRPRPRRHPLTCSRSSSHTQQHGPKPQEKPRRSRDGRSISSKAGVDDAYCPAREVASMMASARHQRRGPRPRNPPGRGPSNEIPRRRFVRGVGRRQILHG